MIRSLLLFFVFVAFLATGFAAPFVFSLGYIWVDGFRPQDVSYSILTELPVSMIMAVAAIGGYFVLDRRFPPKPSAQLVLTLLFAVWVTLTTSWAEVPDPAWIKWDWAFKTIVFSAFIPYVFRSSIQIEAFALIWLLALSANTLPVGAKTILSGGGYGHALGLVAGNSGFAEGSTLAAISLMMVPIFIFLRQHGRIIPRSPLTSLGYVGAIALSIAAAVGTYERTALVGAAVMGGHLWWHARRKLLFGVIAAVVVLAAGGITSQRWIERMSTVQTFHSESSALGRILVWKWTFDYALHHPLGGGFDVYRIDRIQFPNETADTPPHTIAFHSAYFEVLGEQGWVGLGLFVSLIATSLVTLRGVAKRTRDRPDFAWSLGMARALQGALLTFVACSAFIGVGFQPMFYFLFAMTISLREYTRRAMEGGGELRGRSQVLPRRNAPALTADADVELSTRTGLERT